MEPKPFIASEELHPSMKSKGFIVFTQRSKVSKKLTENEIDFIVINDINELVQEA